MSEISIDNLTKKFGKIVAVKDFNITVSEKEFVTLLGPSGCGKTTTLRIIAGLEKATTGDVYIGKKLVSSSDKGIFLPPDKRNIGMVFQSYAIWPHMTVFENIAYPLRIKKINKKMITQKMEKVLSLVKLKGLENRTPSQISGGQQQRVAVARSLVMEPNVLLLDEPLSNLDAKLREQMRIELKDLQKKLGITVVYVTHDQAEGIVMSDRIVVMNSGVIQQIAPPKTVYKYPANTFVADFIGMINFIEAKVVSKKDNKGKVLCLEDSKQYLVNCNLVSENIKCSDQIILAVRPEDIVISEEKEGIHTRLLRTIFCGDKMELRLVLGDSEIKTFVDTDRFNDVEGSRDVYIQFKKAAGYAL